MWLVTVQRSTRRIKGLIGPLVLVSIASLLISACGSSSGPPSAPTVARSGAPLYVQGDLCYTPEQYRVAYGIQSLLDRGIDGRGETVTVVTPFAQPGQGTTDIRQDLESFDRAFRLPAAHIDVVTSLVGSASRWQVTG